MSCTCRTVCSHRYSSRDAFTSLEFGVFLFAFAYFLAFAPVPSVRLGVDVMTSSALTMSDAFALFADSMNGQVASLIRTQIETAGTFGSALALVGNTVGEGTARFVTHPEVFRDNLRLNMRTLVAAWSPRPIHQYKWSKSHRFWTGNPKGIATWAPGQVVRVGMP